MNAVVLTDLELQTLFDSGQTVLAVKLLRAQTGCGLKVALDALRTNTVSEMETFAAVSARKMAESAAMEMLVALQSVRALIAEAAMTGFDWKAGDWTERLFHSQQATSNAIAKATRAQ